VVIDIDGTLVDRHGRIAQEDKDAIARLTREFVKVSLCTGRVLEGCRPIIEELNLNTPHIMFDGALIHSPLGHATLYRKPIAKDTVAELVKYCRENKVYLELYSASGISLPRVSTGLMRCTANFSASGPYHQL
jgi:HAD superfamily hydrolase (TIGR01484 family)